MPTMRAWMEEYGPWDEYELIAEIRARLGRGDGPWRVCQDVFKHKRNDLAYETIRHHVRSIQAEMWIEKGMNVNRMIDTLVEQGEVTIPKEVLHEFRRRARGAGIGFEEVIVIRRVEALDGPVAMA